MEKTLAQNGFGVKILLESFCQRCSNKEINYVKGFESKAKKKQNFSSFKWVIGQGKIALLERRRKKKGNSKIINILQAKAFGKK